MIPSQTCPLRGLFQRASDRGFRRLPAPLVSALALAALAALSSGCGKPEAPVPPPPVVQVAEVVLTNRARSSETIGQLDSPQNVEVRARVEAFVDKMLFTEGVEVKQGDPLFELDRKPYLEQLAAAEGMLAESRAALNKYEKDVARLKPLAEKRAIPQQDLDNAIASVEVGRASVLSAQARVESAQINLGYCDVRAPISGLIGAKQASIGDLVGKGEPTLLATISTLDPIWFYTSFSEVKYLDAEAKVRQSGKRMEDIPFTLILANGSVHPQQGRAVFLDRAVDVKTGTLRARIEFPNPDKLLRPGMFGRIRADLGVEANSILLPERAVVELQGKNFVWVVGGDGRATQRAVKVGETVDGFVQIIEGLKAGERHVVEGIQKVREGTPVKAMTAGEFAEAMKAKTADAASRGKE